MKKVSLLLAVLLALSCCLLMLAACGEEETPADESSSAAPSSEPSSTPSAAESSEEETTSEPEETSEPDETSEPETSEPETSEPETSEPETSEPETSEPETSGGYDGDVLENTDGANLAAGKSYTGGVPSAHPDVAKYNANLTDGKANDAISYDGEWFAFYMNVDATGEGYVNAPDRVGTVVIDLENVYNVSKVQINAFLGNASGIVAPASVKVEISVDGKSYTQLGSVDISKPEENDTTVDWIVIEGNAVAGQYVRVTVTMDAYAPFAFLNEIEVY